MLFFNWFNLATLFIKSFYLNSMAFLTQLILNMSWVVFSFHSFLLSKLIVHFLDVFPHSVITTIYILSRFFFSFLIHFFHYLFSPTLYINCFSSLSTWWWFLATYRRTVAWHTSPPPVRTPSFPVRDRCRDRVVELCQRPASGWTL